MNNSENKDLELYVISCHVDKELQEDVPASVYEINIQAGAALTNKRTQLLNDYDGFDESISDRNERYSEGTAMYWIYKSTRSKYVGISHYRRRFCLDDAELTKLMDEDVDIITLNSMELPQSIKDNYCEVHYKKDWELFMDILLKQSPEYYSFAQSYFDGYSFHPCNMNIFKGKLYKEFGDWAFPICDEYYKRSPWKKDRYQRRDAGFILERLSSMFVDMKIRDGYKVINVPAIGLKTKEELPKDVYNYDTVENAYDTCCKLYSEDKICELIYLVKLVANKFEVDSLRFLQLISMVLAAENERHNDSVTMFEYLPDKWKINLDTIIDAYVALGNMLEIVNNSDDLGAVRLLVEFINSTQYSRTTIHLLCMQKNLDEKRIANIIGDYIK